MTDPARGPTTEELRARVLAAERALKLLHERGLDALDDPGALKSVAESVARIDAFAERLEGRTFYDPARPPLDSEGAERQ